MSNQEYLDNLRQLNNEQDKEMMKMIKENVKDEYVVVIIDAIFRRLREAEGSIALLEKTLSDYMRP